MLDPDRVRGDVGGDLHSAEPVAAGDGDDVGAAVSAADYVGLSAHFCGLVKVEASRVNKSGEAAGFGDRVPGRRRLCDWHLRNGDADCGWCLKSFCCRTRMGRPVWRRWAARWRGRWRTE